MKKSFKDIASDAGVNIIYSNHFSPNLAIYDSHKKTLYVPPIFAYLDERVQCFVVLSVLGFHQVSGNTKLQRLMASDVYALEKSKALFPETGIEYWVAAMEAVFQISNLGGVVNREQAERLNNITKILSSIVQTCSEQQSFTEALQAFTRVAGMYEDVIRKIGGAIDAIPHIIEKITPKE